MGEPTDVDRLMQRFNEPARREKREAILEEVSSFPPFPFSSGLLTLPSPSASFAPL